MSFSENLREMLDLKDIELKELSAGTGISKNTLDNYISGQKSLPNAENAVRIAQFLGTTVEFLVTGNKSNDVNELMQVFFNLQKLKEKDFVSIKTIVSSLAEKKI